MSTPKQNLLQELACFSRAMRDVSRQSARVIAMVDPTFDRVMKAAHALPDDEPKTASTASQFTATSAQPTPDLAASIADLISEIRADRQERKVAASAYTAKPQASQFNTAASAAPETLQQLMADVRCLLADLAKRADAPITFHGLGPYDVLSGVPCSAPPKQYLNKLQGSIGTGTGGGNHWFYQWGKGITGTAASYPGGLPG